MRLSCEELVARLASPDLRILGRAARSLERPARVECLVQALRSFALTDSQRVVLCGILCRLRAAAAVPTLLDELRRPDPGVRAVAAEALGAIGDPAAGPDLARLATDASQPVYVRDTAALSVGMTHFVAAWAALVALLRDPARTVRSCAARALQLLGVSEAAEPLAAALAAERDEGVRQHMREALAALKASPAASGTV